MNDGTYAKASQMATAGAARLASATGHAAAGTWLVGTTTFGCAMNPNPASRVSIDRSKHRSRRIQGSWP